MWYKQTNAEQVHSYHNGQVSRYIKQVGAKQASEASRVVHGVTLLGDPFYWWYSEGG